MGDKIFVVHGASYLRSENYFFQKVIELFYAMFNVRPSYVERRKWAEELGVPKKDICYLKWSGSIFDVGKTVDELVGLIESERDVKIVSSSIGTHIALQAAKRTSNVKRIVALCGVFSYIDLDVEFIDIVSRKDLFQSFFRFCFNPFGRSLQSLKIIVPRITHDMFQDNPVIMEGYFKGKKVSDLINYFL